RRRHRIEGFTRRARRLGGGTAEFIALGDDVAKALQALIGQRGGVLRRTRARHARRRRRHGRRLPGGLLPAGRRRRRGGPLVAARRLLGRRGCGFGGRCVNPRTAGGLGLDLTDRFLERQTLARDVRFAQGWHHAAQLRDQRGAGPLVQRTASLTGILF